jgi:hypothetical protein
MIWSIVILASILGTAAACYLAALNERPFWVFVVALLAWPIGLACAVRHWAVTTIVSLLLAAAIALVVFVSMNPEDSDMNSLAKENGIVVVEHSEWVNKVVNSLPYQVCKAEIRRTLLGTPTTEVIGFVRGNGFVYYMNLDSFEKFLAGDDSALPKPVDLTVK